LLSKFPIEPAYTLSSEGSMCAERDVVVCEALAKDQKLKEFYQSETPDRS